MANIILFAIALTFITTSVASSKIKTLKKIKAGSITNPYIANDAVTAEKIQENAIGWSEISSGTVGSDEIADGSVATGDILNGSIIADDLADSSITAPKISDGAITNADIGSSAAIAGGKISPDFGSQTISSANASIATTLNTTNIEGQSGVLHLGATTNTSSIEVGKDTTFTGSGIFNGGISVDSPSSVVSINSSSWDVDGTSGIISGLWGITSVGDVDFAGAAKMTIPKASGAPASSACDASDEIGSLYLDNSNPPILYVCAIRGGSPNWDKATLTD